jgi:hypothetical protein
MNKLEELICQYVQLLHTIEYASRQLGVMASNNITGAMSQMCVRIRDMDKRRIELHTVILNEMGCENAENRLECDGTRCPVGFCKKYQLAMRVEKMREAA